MESGAHIILLAAGRSRRMAGKDKLTEEIDGQPLLRRSAIAALGSAADAVHVVLPIGAHYKQTALSDLPVQTIKNPNSVSGMASSIVCAVQNLPLDALSAVIAPADMPDLTANDYNLLITHWQRVGGICRGATVDGQAGHPVLFPQPYFEQLMRLTGDQGARGLLDDYPEEVELIRLQGLNAVTDLDTPDDWARWRKSQNPDEFT